MSMAWEPKIKVQGVHYMEDPTRYKPLEWEAQKIDEAVTAAADQLKTQAEVLAVAVTRGGASVTHYDAERTAVLRLMARKMVEELNEGRRQ